MSDAIHRVVIKCPATGAVVSTVLRLKPTAFEALTGEYSFRCERCGEIHVWSREKAWLENAWKRIGAKGAA
jgi:uncharacterized C2H2 Zn-finger protein